MDVDDIACSVVLFLPDVGDDPVPGEDLVLVAHEEFQNVEFAAAQGDDLLAYATLPGDGVQDEGAALEERALLFGTPANEGVYAGDQLSEIERLDQIVIGAPVEAFDSVIDGILGRQHDDGRVFPLLTQLLDRLKAIDAGQHDVDDETVVVGGSALGQALFTVVGAVDGEPVFAEAFGENLDEVLVILDDQNFHRQSLLLDIF